MKKNSISKKYVLILFFSLLPFIIGISYSLFQNSDRAFYSAAINISGSERMRTMLLSNYSQFYVHSNLRNDMNDIAYSKAILLEEKTIYENFYNALLMGDSNLSINPPQ